MTQQAAGRILKGIDGMCRASCRTAGIAHHKLQRIGSSRSKVQWVASTARWWLWRRRWWWSANISSAGRNTDASERSVPNSPSCCSQRNNLKRDWKFNRWISMESKLTVIKFVCASIGKGRAASPTRNRTRKLIMLGEKYSEIIIHSLAASFNIPTENYANELNFWPRSFCFRGLTFSFAAFMSGNSDSAVNGMRGKGNWIIWVAFLRNATISFAVHFRIINHVTWNWVLFRCSQPHVGSSDFCIHSISTSASSK